MKTTILFALLCLSSGCATMQAVSRMPAIQAQTRTVIVFAEVVDQSTQCTMKLTQFFGDKLSPGNNCHE